MRICKCGFSTVVSCSLSEKVAPKCFSIISLRIYRYCAFYLGPISLRDRDAKTRKTRAKYCAICIQHDFQKISIPRNVDSTRENFANRIVFRTPCETSLFAPFFYYFRIAKHTITLDYALGEFVFLCAPRVLTFTNSANAHTHADRRDTRRNAADVDISIAHISRILRSHIRRDITRDVEPPESHFPPSWECSGLCVRFRGIV